MIKKYLVIVLTLAVMLSSNASVIAEPQIYQDQVIIAEDKKCSISAEGDYQVLVTFIDGSGTTELLEIVRQMDVSYYEKLTRNIYLLHVPPEITLADSITAISRFPQVEHAQPNYIYEPTDISVNDLYFDYQWALQNSGQYGGLIGADVDALDAWSLTTGSGSVVVAVIDSGVDVKHEDLINQLWVNEGEVLNGIDDDGNGYVDDIHGWDFYKKISVDSDDYLPHFHGTHIAGIIAAEQNNAIGVSGLAPDVRIMPLNFMAYDDVETDSVRGNTGLAIQAIEYARLMGADIVNASWGTMNYDKTLRDVIGESGMLFAAAAGNEGVDVDISSNREYPSGYDLPNLVSVAAIDRIGNLAYFSNYGARYVHVAAPGHEILSTWPGNEYAYASGTSMAAPYVSAIAALIMSEYPALKPDVIKDLIVSGTVPMDNLSSIISSGGLVNAYDALSFAGLIGTSDMLYPVIFRSWDNTILSRQDAVLGSSAQAPAVPSRAGYKFVGWDQDFSNISGPLSIWPIYEPITYTVNFVDWDGRLISSQTVEHGSAANEPELPVREGYTFAGWDSSFSNITAGLTVKAEYAINSYDVVFKNWDGMVLKTERVKYGQKATAPTVPGRTGFSFSGWDTDFSKISKNITVNAQFAIIRLTTSGQATISYDVQNQYLYGLAAGSTITHLTEQFINPTGLLRVYTWDNKLVTEGSAKVATGMRLQLYDGSVIDEREIVVRGDINGDGQITALDLLQVKQHLLGRGKLVSSAQEAGRISGQETVSALDLLQMKRHLLGQIEIK